MHPKPGALWRPRDEAEATGNLAVFVEWLRATGRRPHACPGDVAHWRAAEPAAARQAVAAFAGVEAGDPMRLEALAVTLLDDDRRPDDPTG